MSTCQRHQKDLFSKSLFKLFQEATMHNAFILLMDSYTLVWVFWDELPFTVDAGVGALAGDLLLLLRDAAWWRGRPTCVEGT